MIWKKKLWQQPHVGNWTEKYTHTARVGTWKIDNEMVEVLFSPFFPHFHFETAQKHQEKEKKGYGSVGPCGKKLKSIKMKLSHSAARQSSDFSRNISHSNANKLNVDVGGRQMMMIAREEGSKRISKQRRERKF